NRGFENVPDPHDVYGMVDSVNVPGGGQISEPDETNNVSNPLSVAGVIPQNTPTPTPTFDLAGSKIIAGVVQSRIISWVPQQRADVYLYDTNLGQVVARMQTDENGFYLFDNVPDSTYTVYSCLQNTDFFGLRTGIVPTNPVTNIYMLPDHPGGCNLTPPSNTLPAVTNPGSQTNYVGDTVSLTIAATDADGDTLTYSATGLPSGLSINTNTGEISGTLPQGSQGVYSVSVNVYDGQDSTSVFFIWTVLNVKLEAKLVNSVTTTWKTVSLSNSYDSMVVVCTVRYAANTAPIVPRVRNASGSSFQVRLQNPGDNDTPTTSSVYCLVVEEGTWRLPDGRKLEAQKVNSTITDNAGSWVGQIVSYNQSYTNPVVLGQVMTFNDSRWSTFWSRANSSQKDPADSGSIRVGKHIGDDSDTARNNETIGFIVIEAGHGTVDGVEYEFQLGGDSIGGAGNNGSNTDTYNFTNGFSNTPVFGVLSQAAMDGSDGSWAVLKTSTPFTKTVLELVVDEDQIGDNERNHTNEQVGYAVFDDLIVLNGLEK
ncbi:MAG: putative Ig domain-containing protein, partial [Anaerolineales bacterium]|nr:putative Ig domain-containing protein [Anaerolineales bacterium]